jgi:hypothetical protein
MKRVDFDASSWSWTCSLCQKQKALLESCCKDCGSKRREKVVCFVRHGEAEHNVRKKRGLDEPKVRDPSLTPRGVEQAQTLRAHLETVLPQFDVAVSSRVLYCLSDLTHALQVVSPLRRALQTAHELKLEKVVISHLHAERFDTPHLFRSF